MATKEEKEKTKVKREKMSGLFLDIATLSFATMVLTNFTPLLNGGGMQNGYLLIGGIVITGAFLVWLYTKSGKKWLKSLDD